MAKLKRKKGYAAMMRELESEGSFEERFKRATSSTVIKRRKKPPSNLELLWYGPAWYKKRGKKLRRHQHGQKDKLTRPKR